MQRGQDNRESRRTAYLDRSANSIININAMPASRETSVGTTQLDNQTLCRSALQSHPTVGMVVCHVNVVVQNMDHVCVVPDALGRQRSAADFHPVDTVVPQEVAVNEWPVIVIQSPHSLSKSCAASSIDSRK